MAYITKQDIAQTLMKLMRAGKQMPQMDKVKVATNTQEAAQMVLKQTTELFGEVFFPQKIGVERWNQATIEALTLTKADTLNVNLITPALMQTALKNVEVREMEAARVSYQQAKEEEKAGVNFEANDSLRRQNALAWEWTKQKLGCGADLTRWLPKEHQIVSLALQMGMTREQRQQNGIALTIYLADKAYCEACKCGENLKCYLRGKTKTLEITDDGEVTFGSTPCDRFLHKGVK